MRYFLIIYEILEGFQEKIIMRLNLRWINNLLDDFMNFPSASILYLPQPFYHCYCLLAWGERFESFQFFSDL